jgi:exodeoxyribonuclease VII large subunit
VPADLVFTPTDFVAILNQTLEYAYPQVVIEGELTNFRVAKNRWVYFDLKDESSSVKFFGSVYQLPGPLQDGIIVRAIGVPRLHQRFGFSVNFSGITPVGEGALKKAADLLHQKLQKEGLFEVERKRPLPAIPDRVGLITADQSAARADFIKILGERWGGVEIIIVDSLVQGDQAPAQLASAIKTLNNLFEQPEVIVITRGGGSTEDLAAFNDERLVRAVAASRIPTLIAIGHETDESLAELVADMRASTPSNAAMALTPDRYAELKRLDHISSSLDRLLLDAYNYCQDHLQHISERLNRYINNLFDVEYDRLKSAKRLAQLFDPNAVLQRGYAIVTKNSRHMSSIKNVKKDELLGIKLADGTITSKVESVVPNA